MQAPELIDEKLRSPRYIQAYSMLRDWIYQGVYPPGAKLPPEGELCKTFGVSRITIRKAIDMLVDEKLVVRQQGLGTFVVKDLAAAPITGDMQQLLRKVQRLDKNTQIVDTALEDVVADAAIAKDLALAADSHVLRATHLRLLDGQPIGYVEACVPAALGLSFTTSELRQHPLLILLEKKGVKVSAADQLIGAALADTRMARMLGTTVGAALVKIQLIVFDDKQRPVERMLAWYRADHYQHHVYLTRKPGESLSAFNSAEVRSPRRKP